MPPCGDAFSINGWQRLRYGPHGGNRYTHQPARLTGSLLARAAEGFVRRRRRGDADRGRLGSVPHLEDSVSSRRSGVFAEPSSTARKHCQRLRHRCHSVGALRHWYTRLQRCCMVINFFEDLPAALDGTLLESGNADVGLKATTAVDFTQRPT